MLVPANGRSGGIRVPFQTSSYTARNVLILDVGGGYMGVDICKNYRAVSLGGVHFALCKWYLN